MAASLATRGGATLAKPSSTAESPPAPAQPLAGVLFDVDGTLIDTEFIAPLAWRAVLDERGVDVSGAEDVFAEISKPAMRGANAMAIAEYLIQAFELDTAEHSLEALSESKRNKAVELVVGGEMDLASCWYPDVPEALRRLARVVGKDGIGLCTSNLRLAVTAQLDAAPGGSVRNMFAGGTTMQEDIDGCLKPRPEPYSRALRLLGRPPATIAAVEDSVVGVKSAVAAGVGVVLGVLNREDAAEAESVAAALSQAGAAHVFRTTAEAVEWCARHVDPVTSLEAARTADAECAAKEAVVRQYFDSVTAKDRASIEACFADTVQLRDVCGPTQGALRTSTPAEMAERCMQFVAAHPDCVVHFANPPRADRDGEWVWAHWFETGTWSGQSEGIEPDGRPLDVAGHTRFYVEDVPVATAGGEIQKRITKQVVFRTFAQWELSLPPPEIATERK